MDREILDCYFTDDIDTIQAFWIENGLKPLALLSWFNTTGDRYLNGQFLLSL
jgi:hypothetical protein